MKISKFLSRTKMKILLSEVLNFGKKKILLFFKKLFFRKLLSFPGFLPTLKYLSTKLESPGFFTEKNIFRASSKFHNFGENLIELEKSSGYFWLKFFFNFSVKFSFQSWLQKWDRNFLYSGNNNEDPQIDNFWKNIFFYYKPFGKRWPNFQSHQKI